MYAKTIRPLFATLDIPDCDDCGERKTLVGDGFICINCNANAADVIDTKTDTGLLVPRDYQNVLIERVRIAFRNGARCVLLVLPTGGGKTLVAAYILKGVIEKDNRANFLADRVNLIHQTSKRLYEVGIPHGIAQSINTRDPHENIQVVSIQTAEKRGFLSKNAPDLTVVDEAHITRKQVVDAIKTIKAAEKGRVLGLTATPLTAGLGDLYDALVCGDTTSTLMKKGWLVPLTVFPMTPIDMKGAKKDKFGEWTDKEVENRGKLIVGDIVKEWKEKTTEVFGGPRPTLVFTATVEQGRKLEKAFNDAGYNFVQLAYNDGRTDKEREDLLEMYKEGKLDGLISCCILERGFDAPNAEVLICARPYNKSIAAWIQMIGRVIRISPATNKTKAILIDHSLNWEKFYEDVMNFFDFGIAYLPKGKKAKAKINRKEKERGEPRKCPKCSASMPPRSPRCNNCGFEFPTKTTIQEVEGTATRVDQVGHDKKTGMNSDGKWVWDQVLKEANSRYPDNFIKAGKRARWMYGLITKRSPAGLEWSDISGPVHPDIAEQSKHLAKVAAIRRSYGKKKYAKGN